MAELVDATDLKSVDLLIVRVRFPLSVAIHDSGGGTYRAMKGRTRA